MSWLYPEQWPGWMDHARVGGGVFDDAPGFVQLLTSCWNHYATTSGMAGRIPLSPPPTIHINVHQDAWSHPQWQPLFAYAREWFRPELHGIALPFAFRVQPDDLTLTEARNFTFHIDSPQHQSLTCFFYLGQQPVGATDLGVVNLASDRRQWKIHRKLGMTRGSDVKTCYQNSALWQELPEEMQRDLRYIGWTLQFFDATGQPEARVEALPAVGFLEGGDLLLKEGNVLQTGVSTPFFQGWRNGQPVPELLCRLLLVPKGVQPAAPHVHDIECYLHDHPNHPTRLSTRVWLKSTAMNEPPVLEIIEPALRIPLTGGQTTAPGILLYHADIEAPTLPTADTTIRYKLHGTNSFGLSFPATSRNETTIRRALSAKITNAALLSREQLQHEWELQATLDLPPNAHTPEFDLAAVTLWLQSERGTAHIPLAHIAQHTMTFRYLPRTINLQTPIDTLAQSEVLHAWIEQKRPHDQSIPAHHGWLSQVGNEPKHPLQTFRIMELAGQCQQLQPEYQHALPACEEMAIEGYRLQLLPAPTTTNREHTPHDVLLFEPRHGHKHLLLTTYGDGQLHIHQEAHTHQGTQAKAIWLSCGQTDHWIHDPRERNPEGGPCLAFGLGFGQTQEMAQIRPQGNGFALFRHRHHIAAYADGHPLPVEPYEGCQGWRLGQQGPTGWLCIEQALLRYELQQQGTTTQLSLAHVGAIIPRQTHNPTLVVAYGTPDDHATSAQITPHLHLPGDKRQGTIHLQVVPPPAPGQRPPLLIQEHLPDTLPRQLAYGERLTYGSCHLACWELKHDNPASLLPDHQQHEANQTLALLELMKPYGRKRFFLSQTQGRLGYWREGSAFLTSMSAMQSTPAPSHARQLPGNLDAPPNALIVGTDITIADLPLPTHIAAPSSLLFAISETDNHLCIHPLGATCYPVELRRFRDGKVEWLDGPAFQAGNPILPATQSKCFFRTGPLLFELSRAQEDKTEQPDADLLLSLRGLCHPLGHPLPIGGPQHLTPFPILDPVPPFSPDAPLLTLTQTEYHATIKGDALVGLHQPESNHSLGDWLERELQQQQTEVWPDTPTPLHALLAHKQSHTAIQPDNAPTPPFLHENHTLPQHFLTDSHILQLDSHQLMYQFRTREDGHPTVDRAPAKLLFSNPPDVTLSCNPSGHGFLHPDGTQLERLIIGRHDPEQPAEQWSSSDHNIELSQPFSASPSQGKSAKCMLVGYAPRRALSLTCQQGQLHLHIPAPGTPDQHHIVLNGTPITEETTQTVTDTVTFHVNHLLLCRLSHTDDKVTIQLQGYLLGHQRDPGTPMQIVPANRIGCIHIRTNDTPPAIALQTTVRSAHFHPISTPTKEPGPSGTLGPIETGDGQRCALVDLQQWSPPPHLLNRPARTDRLLWCNTANDTPGGWLHQPPPPTSTPQDWAFGSPGDEGSSFAFGSPKDEGSSFAFAPGQAPVQEADTLEEQHPHSRASITTDDVGLASSTGILETDPAAIVIGWRRWEEGTDRFFGWLREAGGPSVILHRNDMGHWILSPSSSHTATSTSTTGERPHPHTWSNGRWTPLLPHTEVRAPLQVQCGQAGFLLQPDEQHQGILIQRQWCWLPTQQELTLIAAQLSTATHAQMWGLTHTDPAFGVQILPMQRGHWLHIKPTSSSSATENQEFAKGCLPEAGLVRILDPETR